MKIFCKKVPKKGRIWIPGINLDPDAQQKKTIGLQYFWLLINCKN